MRFRGNRLPLSRNCSQLFDGCCMTAVEILEDLFVLEGGYLNGNHFVYRSPEPVPLDTAYVSGSAETEKTYQGLGSESFECEPDRQHLQLSRPSG